MKIWAHTIVHNEDKFIWFAVMSIVDFVDKVMVWDTGSDDKTVDIVKEVIKLKGDKIDFREIGPVDKYQFTTVRQKMLEESECDWILILDGDEVWWDKSIRELVNTINNEGHNLDAIVVPMVVPVGDLYHIQDESAGRYAILGKKGHINLRAFNHNIPGVHVDQPYGSEGYFDKDKNPIQTRKKIKFLGTPYLHVTHLTRSSKKRFYNKIKYELGRPVTIDFTIPEVFFLERPGFVLSPVERRSWQYVVRATIETFLKKIKRCIFYE